MRRIAIVSDIHYAGPGEFAHGPNFEFDGAPPSFGKSLATLYRNHIWMRNPVGNNHLLERFLERAGTPDLVIANGDYTCDVAGLGVAHDEALESVQICLGKLRARFGDRLHAIMGDHELGKVTLLGHRGGLRLQAWRRATGDCGLRPFWRVEVGNFVLLGVTSTLIGLPMFHSDALAEEWPEWERLRAAHLAEIRAAFAALRPEQRVVLFCHDPSALPQLWREEAVRAKTSQIAHTIVGHLHTRILLWKTRALAGLPPLRGCGVSLQRMTSALSEAKHWRPFNVCLCPSLAGIQMLRGGGFLTMEVDETAEKPPRITFHRISRNSGAG
jgi:hypothetical protein